MSDAARLLLAVLLLVATAALYVYVSSRPLTALDAASERLRGEATPLAVFFTRAGYWPVIAGLTIAAGTLEFILRGGIVFTLVLAATQLLSQGVSDIAKSSTRRVRPSEWLFRQEGGFSFPSGHATTAIVFFGGLLYFMRGLPLTAPAHVALGIVTAAFVVGIPWSRMALAAHYATDVLGGLLFGGAWLCIMIAVLRHLHIGR